MRRTRQSRLFGALSAAGGGVRLAYDKLEELRKAAITEEQKAIYADLQGYLSPAIYNLRVVWAEVR